MKYTNMAKANDFINFKAVSRYLAGNSESIRKNKVPKIYLLDVEYLTNLVDAWIKEIEETKKLNKS